MDVSRTLKKAGVRQPHRLAGVLAVAWFLSDRNKWLLNFLEGSDLRFRIVGLEGGIDISRPHEPIANWFKYLWLAIKARLRTKGCEAVVTVFPRLGTVVGLIFRALGCRLPIIIWHFNCGHRYRGLGRVLVQFGLKQAALCVVHSTTRLVPKPSRRPLA